MKINGLQPPANLQVGDKTRTNSATNTNRTEQGEVSSAAVTHLSSVAQNDQQDINMARVEEVRAALQRGELTMRTDKIADALLAGFDEGTGE
ncbi:flagellar biosynthesis anti-sigma factor FlgM [Pseudidiomarina insulisalsae]|uniref:Negative regulator of flagellin synthesis n=1 Tax=Pseudidiomarina insulisalsae TaxID=575789 RepID=A0A432YDX3_9GAMM|nr:flagellar biosynthesis anti-sigma factor FlgM [Pseudidiomarina insulisalsae]RUO59032.1 flagellar biosynthesis anti-sigma factor FlgM [Pseudidiomarina insulisalsae]